MTECPRCLGIFLVLLFTDSVGDICKDASLKNGVRMPKRKQIKGLLKSFFFFAGGGEEVINTKKGG